MNPSLGQETGPGCVQKGRSGRQSWPLRPEPLGVFATSGWWRGFGIVYETSCQRADAGDGVAERRLLDRVSQRSRGPPKPSHAQAFPPGTDCSLVTQS